MISGSGPLDRLCEEKNTCGTVGDVPVHTTVRLQNSRCWKKYLIFWSSLSQPQIVRLMSFTHFLELRDAGGLYNSTRDLPDTTRGKLVVIEASRVLSACIFVCGVLRVITQRCVRVRSLTRFGRLRQFLSVYDCPWPSITVGYSVCDGDRALVRRNRPEIDLCGSRNGFDRNLQKKNILPKRSAAASSRQIGLNHSFRGVWRCLRALCPCKTHFAHISPQN